MGDKRIVIREMVCHKLLVCKLIGYYMRLKSRTIFSFLIGLSIS